MPPRPKPAPPRKPNPLKNMRPIVNAPPVIRGGQKAAMVKPKARLCPNKHCETPKIEDGICHNCGTVVDDSNIVSEVQFGESSSGAAVVQGSFVSADQGAAKSLGPAFRRAGGNAGESKEATIRQGKHEIQNMGSQMEIPEPIVTSAVQIFKVCAMHNFIQGRRLDMVGAVCLYSACRKEKPCKVMLIDFADRLQVNVFKLGHCFKALHKTISFAADGIMPIIPEDLIFRFAARLEFGDMTEKVATDAIRMVQRMSLDWMVMGRRPSGVCGACLILAARMNNFRRTVTEVVYIVKVTTNTIQKRLEEFKLTPSSALTVDEFINNEFLESAHDPPSFYQKSEEFLKNKKSKKRKRGVPAEDEDAEEDNAEGSNKRQRDANAGLASPPPTQPSEARKDADGFSIPNPPLRVESVEPGSSTSAELQGGLLPSREGSDEAPEQSVDSNIPIDPALLNEVEELASITEEQLAKEYGDVALDEEAVENNRELSSSNGKSLQVPEAWLHDENELENQISEMINDPNTKEHAAEYARAAKKVTTHMLMVSSKPVNMDVHIGEDEFADDPEVKNCLLAPEEVAKKEKIWVNENKVWLREQQKKLLDKKRAELDPPKATRRRKKKPRIGEGASVAESPAEAAKNMVKMRTWSKKINYDAINSMFKNKVGPGSAATSQVTSRAPSTASDSREGSAAPTVSEQAEDDEVETVVEPGKRHIPNEFGDDEIEEDEEYEEDPEQGDIDPFADQDPDDNFGVDDYEDYE
ncbi:hypothetical protein BP5796_08792 [Coleophoma crateriformis]|uniref:B-related factor 1 n=1 Tax=Coleophoma crateriformis TaxID=565419 RepID=A0A3D8R8M0_9HELO|nr:hypothetical protein BP5796_08792 [Coleophoma crateriformis]